MPVRVDSTNRVETIGEYLDRCGVSRREFLEFCTKLMVAAPFGLALTNKMAAAGKDAEEALHAATEENAGRYVLVVEGALPRRDGGVYLKIANKTGLQVLDDVSK
jgi:hypothetical protein